MASIDERIVQMQFDNKQFENGVNTTISSLDKLKKGLNLKDSAKSFDEINKKAKDTDLSGIQKAVESVKERFSAMGIVGITVLQNITNAALATGANIAKAVTIQPIIDGLHEYELQMNSVQTILANTQKEHTNIDQVNKALDTLNTYADKTIYNFSEMTRNIGTFTAAGVDLQTSVDSIQGIANLAAVSGSSSLQASTAMYQLSQAIAAGKVQLMDWNSVVNAGMGGQVFQDALVRTSEHLKTGAKAAIQAKGSFRESLQEGWLTTQVLTETLKQFSLNVESAEDYEKAVSDLVAQGYTKEEATNIADMARTAAEAATKVKTFSQLIDTLKEALGSGWAMSWRTIIGDFEEAKELWTGVSDVLSSYINESANARNEMLQSWADLGGRQEIIDGLAQAFYNVVDIVKAVHDAFVEVFPPITGQQLFNLSKGFKELMQTMKPSETMLNNIHRIAKGLFSALDLVKQVIMTLLSPIGALIGSGGLGGLLEGLLGIVAGFADFITAIDEAAKSGKVFETVSNTIGTAIQNLVNWFSGLGNGLQGVGNLLSNIASIIRDTLGGALTWISDHVTAGDLFAGISAASIVAVAKQLSGVTGKIKEFIEGFLGGDEKDSKGGGLKAIAENFSSMLESVGDSLNAFTTGVKTASLVAIAGAVAILVGSLKTLSTINAGELVGGLTAIGALLAMLSLTFTSLNKTLGIFAGKGIVKAGASLVLVATSVRILASAMKQLADLDTAGIAKGLVSIGVLLTSLSLFLSKTKLDSMSLKASITLIALAESLKIMASAMAQIGSLSLQEIGKGILGMAGGLTVLVAAVAVLDKVKGSFKNVLVIATLCLSLKKIGEALKDIGSLSWSQIARGLTGIGAALAEFVVIMGFFNAFGKVKISAALSVVVLAQSLKPIGEALKDIGSMKWDTLKRGLIGMGAALAELALVVGVLGKLGGLKSLLGAGSIVISVQALKPIADALQEIGSLSWDQLAVGLTGMGVALVELGTVTAIIGTVAPLGSILGSGAILLGVQALKPIADALQEIGSLSWDQLAVGLTGMAAALAVLGTVTTLTGTLGGLASLIGGGSLLLAVQGLGQLADALKKFSEFNWDQIKTGIAAMTAAMGATAIGGLVNTFSGLGAAAIAEVAEPLGQLADSIRKWEGVSVPENMQDGLTQLASGVGAFTFGGAGAGAISGVAEPLGQLSDSIRKWQGVEVPEGIQNKLSQLASGVMSFTFSGLGAGAISEVAEPLGNLAGSVQKWSGVTVPEGLGGQLSNLASGIMAFTFGGLGAGAISQVAEPLGTLADSVQKWSGVTVPEGIGNGLSQLASGVMAFTFGGFGAGAIGELTEPLGNLADSVQKWSGVTVPEGIGNGLSQLASGVMSFTFSGFGAGTIGELAWPLGQLAESVQKWQGVTVPEGIGDALKQLADGARSMSTVNGEGLSSCVWGLNEMGNAINNINSSNPAGAGQALQSFGNSIAGIPAQISGVATSVSTAMNGIATSISSSSGKFQSAGNLAATALGTGLRSGMASAGSTGAAAARTAVQLVIQTGTTALNAGKFQFQTAGKNMVDGIRQGIDQGKPSAVSAIKNVVTACKDAVRSGNSEFYNAGSYMAQGLASGISSGRSGAVNAARDIARAAVEAAKQEAQIHSPSKKTYKLGEFFTLGLVKGILALKRKVELASMDVASTAVEGISSQARVNITPIVTSDNAGVIRGLSSNKSISLSAKLAESQIVNPMTAMQRSMSLENAEVIRSNDMVVQAIDGLRSDMSGYTDAIGSMENAVYVDGRKLASSIAKPMNQQLGIMTKRGSLA